jgi:hypothetical protein
MPTGRIAFVTWQIGPRVPITKQGRLYSAHVPRFFDSISYTLPSRQSPGNKTTQCQTACRQPTYLYERAGREFAPIS